MSSKSPSAKQKQLVIERAQWRCEYCLCPSSVAPFTFHVDHIIPHSRGGGIELDNLALACGCNNFKGDRIQARDPQTNQIVSLFHPRQQQWSEHFAWSEDGLELIGLTPTGHATVAALRMNRKELVKLRRLLLASGEHPPTD